MSPAFASVLDRPSQDIKRPEPLPVGTYVWLVPPQYAEGTSKQKGTPFVEWEVKCLGATEDVDQEALAASLGEKKLTEKTMKATFYLTENSAFMLKDFLDACGVDDANGTATLRARIAGAGGTQVLGYVRHEPSLDNKYMIAKLSSFAKLPE